MNEKSPNDSKYQLKHKPAGKFIFGLVLFLLFAIPKFSSFEHYNAEIWISNDLLLYDDSTRNQYDKFLNNIRQIYFSGFRSEINWRYAAKKGRVSIDMRHSDKEILNTQYRAIVEGGTEILQKRLQAIPSIEIFRMPGNGLGMDNRIINLETSYWGEIEDTRLGQLEKRQVLAIIFLSILKTLLTYSLFQSIHHLLRINSPMFKGLF